MSTLFRYGCRKQQIETYLCQHCLDMGVENNKQKHIYVNIVQIWVSKTTNSRKQQIETYLCQHCLDLGVENNKQKHIYVNIVQIWVSKTTNRNIFMSTLFRYGCRKQQIETYLCQHCLDMGVENCLDMGVENNKQKHIYVNIVQIWVSKTTNRNIFMSTLFRYGCRKQQIETYLCQHCGQIWVSKTTNRNIFMSTLFRYGCRKQQIETYLCQHCLDMGVENNKQKHIYVNIVQIWVSKTTNRNIFMSTLFRYGCRKQQIETYLCQHCLDMGVENNKQKHIYVNIVQIWVSKTTN